jgi:hypothetical protein
MSSAARPYGPKNGGTYVERARAAWGTVPDKIMHLALACDLADNLSVVAERIGYSVSAISSVLANTYKGRMDRIEAAIDGVLMQAEVYCPAAGMKLARNVCADHQKQKIASSASPLAARFPAACRGCTHSFGGNNA